MREIGIGIVGGGYMGKAHSVAMSSVGAVFNTHLRPRLQMICARTDSTAEKYRKSYGFKTATSDWSVLVKDPAVEAVIIATPQTEHREIAMAAFAVIVATIASFPLKTSISKVWQRVLAMGLSSLDAPSVTRTLICPFTNIGRLHFNRLTEVISTKGRPLASKVSMTSRVAKAAICQPLAHRPPNID